MESPTVSSSGTSPERTGHHPEALHTITMERTDTRSYASSFQGTQYHKYDSDTSEIQAPREIVAGAASSSQDPQPQHHNFYNWPNLDLLPSKCDHSYEYRLKCVPLQNAALKGDWEEAKPTRVLPTIVAFCPAYIKMEREKFYWEVNQRGASWVQAENDSSADFGGLV
ncbi:hypothetical protein Dsin_029492 [Dipteronia sinensis]|uniref:Uncharacterized protein n=1 Tax=Dipteronia sinensis TaxID=43782 RepID=A0AAD9ZU05_9ROSI|nr:hypothetical protein Dsin_029492 [Dipteronia sinensis]